MMVKTLIAFAVTISCYHTALSQDQQRWIALETDPMTTLFGARTLSIIVDPPKPKHWTLFLNVVSADFPGWMDDFLNPNNKGKGFDSKISIGGGMSIDYFLKDTREGIYFGLVNLFFKNEVEKNGSSAAVVSHNLIPRAGYRWYPFKRKAFYVNPFLGIRYESLTQSAPSVDGSTFEAAGLQPFGTVHIGYHF